MPRYLDEITKAKYELIEQEILEGKTMKEACQKYCIKSSSFRNWFAKRRPESNLAYVEPERVELPKVEEHLPIFLPKGLRGA